MQEWLQKSIETFQFGSGDETPYVTIRALVEKIGLSWAEERGNLIENDHWGYREEEVEMDGRHVKVFGLPANRVFIWLKSVDVSRVLPELRQPLFEYQEQSRQMTRSAFLQSDLLTHARAKPEAERSALEQKLVEAADLLAQKETEQAQSES